MTMACSITWSYSPARTCVSYKRNQINKISNYEQDWNLGTMYLKVTVLNAVELECLNRVQGQRRIITVILDFLPIILYCKVWSSKCRNNLTQVEILYEVNFHQFGLLKWLTVSAEMAFRSECLPWMVGRQYGCKNKSNRENLDHQMTTTISKLWDNKKCLNHKCFWVFEKCWVYLREIPNQVELIRSVQGRLDHGLGLWVTSVKFGLQGFL